MIEFGKTLRAAREARGYTVAQIAEMTRMAPATVSELESEHFERIAAPIYGRGFVKLYCEAVGIEAKPMVDEFMEIYSGNRDVGIRERQEPVEKVAPATAPEPPPQPVFPPVTEPVGRTAGDNGKDAELELISDPVPETASVFAAEPPPAQPTFSRYATPLHDDPGEAAPPSGSLVRMAAVGIVLLAVLAAIGYGIVALYRATSSVAPAAESASAKTPSAARTTPRTPQKLPSLYID